MEINAPIAMLLDFYNDFTCLEEARFRSGPEVADQLR